ncbi:MAG: hypothetical protein U5Q03_16440 [Bacteroidota bacterium]|nr:hypothetical protein [Bacteroidota bacterium]
MPKYKTNSMINPDKLKFIQLDYHGLQTLVKWAEQEGWNSGNL